MVDQNMMEGLLGFTSKDLKNLSQSYSVNGIKANGAFHPKINFLVGDKKILLFFGSGNITAGGHGKNHELFTGFFAESVESPQLHLIQEGWNYLNYLCRNLSGYSAERIFKIIPQNTDLLSGNDKSKHIFHKLDNKVEAALLYNEDTNIFEQLIKLIPKSDINKITVVSPYFDENGEAIVNLIKYFKSARMEVYFPDQFGLPPTKIKSNKRIQFFAWENTNRSHEIISGKTNYARRLHSKIFHFKSNKFEYCLIGSANATIFGLGSLDKRALNEEFCVLFKFSNRDILKEFGIYGKKKEIDPRNFERNKTLSLISIENKESKKDFFIDSCDLRGLNLYVFINNTNQLKDKKIVLFNNSGEIIFSELVETIISNQIILNLKYETILKNPSYLALSDTNMNIVSNKQIINFLDKLYQTDPSKAARAINQLINNSLSAGDINGFELLNYLNELNSKKEKEVKYEKKQNVKKNKVEDIDFTEMTYYEALESLKNIQCRSKLFQTYNSIRLWDVISQIFNEKIQRNLNDSIDDEETGDPETGITIVVEPPGQKPIELENKKAEDGIIKKLKKLTANYVNSIHKIRFDNDHKINVIDLSQFLLVTHILNEIVLFNKYKLDNSIQENEWNGKIRSNYNVLMKSMLLKFSELVIGCSLEEIKNDEYQNNKLKEYIKSTINYALLNIYLVNKLSQEEFVKNELQLIILNIFYKLGLPDEQFEQFTYNISQSHDEFYFNVESFIFLKNDFLRIYSQPMDGQKYFVINHSGICLVLENNQNEVKYKSVFNTYTITHKKFEEHLKKSKIQNGD